MVAGVPGEASEQGNVSVNVTVQDGYQPAADTTKPTVTVAVTANAGNSEWLTTAPFATVQATDDTAPIAKLEISADQGKSWTTIAANANAAIATLSQQGDVECGLAPPIRPATFRRGQAGGKVDSAAPTVTAAADKEERTLTLTADDGTGSGVAS